MTVVPKGSASAGRTMRSTKLVLALDAKVDALRVVHACICSVKGGVRIWPLGCKAHPMTKGYNQSNSGHPK